jgi:4-amino-4-deoxy-L-arabinose transferase-like glycosyltransferase
MLQLSSTTRLIAEAIAIGFALRLLVYWLVQPTASTLDEVVYEFRATALTKGEDVPEETDRPPGSLWYYSLAQRVFGANVGAIRLSNVLAGIVLIAAMGAFGVQFGGRAAGTLTAWILAFYPNLVFYSVSAWSETLYLVLAWVGLTLIAWTPGTAAKLAAAGFALGCGALTREIGIGLLPMALLWLLWRGGVASGRTWRSAAIVLVCFAIPIFPWTLRINRGNDHFALVARTNYMNLYYGNVPVENEQRRERTGGVFVHKRDYTKLGRDGVEREAAAKELALRAIRERLPEWPVEKIASEVPKLLTPNSFPAARLLARPTDERFAKRAYRLTTDGTPWERIRDVLGVTAIATWVSVALLGTFGLALSWKNPLLRLLFLYAALHLGPPIAAYGSSRYRLPIEPVFILGAAMLATNRRRLWREAPLPQRAAAIGVVVLVGLIIASGAEDVRRPQWG